MKKLALFSCFLFWAAGLNAQQARLKFSPGMTGLSTPSKISFIHGIAILKKADIRPNATPYLMDCFQPVPFFCRLETRIEKAARLPVKFRIGEVQYVEKLEGKY